MYRKNKVQDTSIEVNVSEEGEPIEHKMERILNNNEPITDGAPVIYTERKDGVMPEYDIRTDRMDLALDAMDKVSGTHIATREEKAEKRRQEREEALGKKTEGKEGEKGGDNGRAESTQGQGKTT